MDASLLAAIGVVVQWSSSLLLCLFFLGLGFSGARRPFVRVWVAAWAALVVSVTGPFVHAVAVLLDDPTFGVAAARWLDFLTIPGALLFAVLAALGVYQSMRARAAIPLTEQTAPPAPDMITVAAEPVVVVALPLPGIRAEATTELVVVAAMIAEPEEPAAPSDELVHRPPSPHLRTATLPLPPLLAHGKLGEALLIDDEAAVRSTLARIFQRGGWPVRDASTGEEALAWLLDVPVDDAPSVILCDFKMPGMGGREIYAHLVQARPELLSRIIFVTGDMGSESTRAFIASTPCLAVEKPFTVTDVASAVEEVLAASSHAIG
jgi:CheY-like chemotaxis protein